MRTAFPTKTCLAVCTFMLTACSSDEAGLSDEAAVYDDPVIAEIIENLHRAGLNDDDITIVESESGGGDGVPEVLIEGDIAISLEASRTLAETREGEGFRHWRTWHLVNTPDICVVPITAAAPGYSSYVLSAKMQMAVAMAIVNYNALDIDLSFRTVGGMYNGQSYTWNNSGCDSYIIIYRQEAAASAGAQADFPNGDGGPGHFIKLRSGMDHASIPSDFREEVVTHEIGHTLGLRHVDWHTRESCGGGVVSEAVAPHGAVHIPGTPDSTSNSIMGACPLDFDEATGEFRGDDVEAFEYLYDW